MAPNSSGGRRPLGVFRPHIVRLNCNLAVRLGCREPNLERGVLFYPLYILRRDKYLSSRFCVCDSRHIIYNRRSEPIFRKNIVVDCGAGVGACIKILGLAIEIPENCTARLPPSPASIYLVTTEQHRKITLRNLPITLPYMSKLVCYRAL